MTLRQLMTAAFVFLVPAAAFAGGINTSVLGDGRILGVGNSRILAAAALSFEDNGNNDFIVGYRAGFNKTIDLEGKVTLNGDAQTFGGGFDYQAFTRKQQAFDLSLGAGLFFTTFNGGHATTVDLNAVGSRPINDKTSFYGGLKIGIVNGEGDSETTAHLVPGIQYRINPQFNLVAELGIGISDSAGTYLGVGVHYNLKK